ncbi:MAG: M48 family metallopeptidase [Fibromonadales bacterium]|nr:M48 family metallopeptidase [Fibromonadales bacterium]
MAKVLLINDIPIELERKRVRNLRLYVSQKDLRAHLTIPFYASEKDAVEFAGSKIQWLKKTLEQMKAKPPVAEISKNEIEELKKIISNLLPEWEFRLGVQAKKWKLRKMKSQWGNCKIKTGEITFSTNLIKKPMRCIEYVVAHELAHLLVANHSAKFYAVIAKHFPYWKEIRKELNK